MHSTVGLLNLGRDLGFTVSLNLLGNESLITRGRNILVSRCLDESAATHLLFIDADIGFDPRRSRACWRSTRMSSPACIR